MSPCASSSPARPATASNAWCRFSSSRRSRKDDTSSECISSTSKPKLAKHSTKTSSRSSSYAGTGGDELEAAGAARVSTGATIAHFRMTALQRLRIDLPTSATVQTRSCGADVMGGQHGSSYVRSGKLNRTFYRLSRRLEGCASSPAVSTTVRVSGHVWRPDLITQGVRRVRLGVREDRAPIRSRAGQRDEVDDCVLQSLMWGFRFRWRWPRCTFLASPPWQEMLSGGRALAQTTQRWRKGFAVNVVARDSQLDLT